jgi:hypothetical protein
MSEAQQAKRGFFDPALCSIAISNRVSSEPQP